ncbi:MAG: Glu-tRNA(Gln) amidotransferase subunit GatD, partial [Candidatus Thorarchaeota archaeon]
MSQSASGYSGRVLEKLGIAGAKIGDTIKIVQNGTDHRGILMPRSQIGIDPDHIVLKLDNGYNIGIRLLLDASITK